MHIVLTYASGRAVVVVRRGLSNRQRIERYDKLIERAQQEADAAPTLGARRHSLNLILRLESRALRELNRPPQPWRLQAGPARSLVRAELPVHLSG